MPANVVRSPHEEKLWRQAKAAAKRARRAGDWAYITSVYERLRSRAGGTPGAESARKKMHRNPRGHLIIRRTRETEAGVAMNPQGPVKMQDDLITEQGVIAPEYRPMESTTDRPQPGMLRVYDKRGRKTSRVQNPQSNPKPMVMSQRALRTLTGSEKQMAWTPVDPTLQKSRARNTRGVFIRTQGAAHKRAKGLRPNPRKRMKGNRPRPGALPHEAGNPLGSPMQESSMQVMAAITQSRRRDPHPDWGFDPAANLPGNTKTPKPVGKPGIFVYKSEAAVRDALHDYAALLDAGKTASVALHQVSGKYPWAQEFDTPRGRDWWAAVRRANLPRPAAYTGLDTEVDADHEDGARPKKAVFWHQTPANLGQGIMAPTGSGGAGR